MTEGEDYKLLKESSEGIWLYTLNWTEPQNQANISLTLTNQIWTIGAGSQTKQLTFSSEPAVTKVKTSQTVNKKRMGEAIGNFQSIDSISSYFGQLDTLATMISFVSQGAPSAPVIQMLKLFKIFNRYFL